MSESRPGARRATWVVGLGLAMSAGTIAGHVAHSIDATVASPEAATATPAAPLDRVVAPGIIEPWGREVVVASEESGRLVSVGAREGDEVRSGQILIELDRSAQEAAVRQARAALDGARAALRRLRAGARPEELSAAAAELEAQATRASLASRVAERRIRLHAAQAIADDEKERALHERTAAAAVAEASSARLRLLRAGARAEEIAEAAARVRQAEAALQSAEAALQRRTLLAPCDGTVLWLRLRPGESYTPGPASRLAVLGDMRRAQVRAEIDELDVARVVIGAPAVITADGFREPLARGRVIAVAPMMGHKTIRSEEATERLDTKVREALIEVPAAPGLVVGLRVRATIAGPPLP